MTEPAPGTGPGTGRDRPGSLTRSRVLVLVTLLAGGLVAVVASAQPWWRAVGAGTRVAFSGTDATGGLSQALGLVVLAGTLLVLVLRARGRRVVGVLLGLAGAALVVVGALRLRPSGDAVRARVREVSLIDQYALTGTAWPWVFAAGGLLVVVGAVLLVRAAPGWASRGERFTRTAPVSVGVDDPAGLWRAQDAGLDPTAPADPPLSADTGRPEDPDVHHGPARDTMGSRARPDPG